MIGTPNDFLRVFRVHKTLEKSKRCTDPVRVEETFSRKLSVTGLMFLSRSWRRGGRVVECVRLESVCGVTHREFS